MKKTIFLALTTLIIAACESKKRTTMQQERSKQQRLLYLPNRQDSLLSLNINEGDILNSGVTVGQIDSQAVGFKATTVGNKHATT